MEMIDLTTGGEQVMDLKNDDHVLLDGHEFVVSVYENGLEDGIFLTTASTYALLGHEQDDLEYPFIHVRAKGTGAAMMKREELAEIISTQAYTIQ